MTNNRLMNLTYYCWGEKILSSRCFAPRFRRLCLDGLKIKHYGKTLVMTTVFATFASNWEVGTGIFTSGISRLLERITTKSSCFMTETF